jgi:hypothetical protein
LLAPPSPGSRHAHHPEREIEIEHELARIERKIAERMSLRSQPARLALISTIPANVRGGIFGTKSQFLR